MSMTSSWRTAFSLVFILLVALTPLRADGTIKVADGQKIAFLGDSITQFGWERPGGYVRLVVGGLASVGIKATPIPAGISGQTSREMLARITTSVINQKPDWMTLSCGVNDVWHGASGVDLETYKKNITSIVDQVQAAGIKVMILTATPIMEADTRFNPTLAGYNDFLRQLAKDRNLPLADLNAACQAALKATPPPSGTWLYTVDGVHMNPEGNIMMARGILEAFGLTSAQIDAYEATWRNSDDAAAVTAGLQLNVVAGVSLADFDKDSAIAQQRKVRLGDDTNELNFDAIRDVLKTHEGDATFTLIQMQAEVPQAFAQRVKALPPPLPISVPAAPPAK